MFFAIDFDGTLSLGDTVDALLAQFAPPAWQEVEADWAEGRISAQECMRRQLRMVTADEAALQRFFENIRIDPTFPAFLDYIRQFAHFAIVSDGIGRAIHTALEVASLPGLPVYANRLTVDDHGWHLEFPHAEKNCAVESGVCKCAVADRLASQNGGGPLVLIGDGRSDACLAGRADVVFARDALARYCDLHGIAYTPFGDFADVLAIVRGWPIVQGQPVLAGL